MQDRVWDVFLVVFGAFVSKGLDIIWERLKEKAPK